MFSKGPSKTNYEKATTLIGEEATLESAVFKSSGTVRIDGRYTGKLEIEGDLVVDSKGVINGTIEAHHSLIAGRVIGDIKCTEEIHLASTANVAGNLFCTNLTIDDGAIFNGNATMPSQAAPIPNKKQPEKEPQPKPN